KPAVSIESAFEEGFGGRLAYASPEHFGLFDGRVGARSDLYSLGGVIAEGATGFCVLPVGGFLEAVEARRMTPPLAGVTSRELRAVLEWLLPPAPQGRPPSASALLQSTALAQRLGADDAEGGAVSGTASMRRVA